MNALDLSNQVELKIYDKDLNLLGVVDSFISLRWKRSFFESGDFELVVVPSENNLSLLKKNNVVLRDNDIEGAIIETREFSDDGDNMELHVSGRLLSSLLSRRIVRKKVVFNGKFSDGMRAIQQSGIMTPIHSKYTLETSSAACDNVSFQVTYKNVYDYIVKLSKSSNVGYKVVADIPNKKYIFQTYLGVDRSHDQSVNDRYIFGEYNVEKASLTDSVKQCYNKALVGGAGEDEERVLVEVGASVTDFDLWEVFVDSKGESQGELTLAQYKEVLKQNGQEKLVEIINTIDFTAYGYDYLDKWDLGDIVDIQLDNFGVLDSYKITEVEEVIEDGRHTIYPTFGTPLATVFAEDTN